jgi:hypothetical protein
LYRHVVNNDGLVFVLRTADNKHWVKAGLCKRLVSTPET